MTKLKLSERLNKELTESGFVIKPEKAITLTNYVLSIIYDHLKENEPYAVNTLSILEQAIEALPESSNIDDSE